MSDTPQGPGWWLASDGKYYPPQQPPPLPGPPQVPGPPPGSGSGGGAKVVWIVLGGLVLVAVLAVIGLAVLLFVRTGSDETVASDTGSSVAPTTAAGSSSGGSSEPTLPSGGGDVVAVESGFSTGEGFDGGPAGNAGAVLRNEGDQAYAFFEVVFTFLDEDGTAVGTETTYVYAIEPGGTAHAAVDAVSLQGPATEVRATVVVDEEPGFWSGAIVPVEVGTVAVDDFFGLEVSGTASNPTDAAVQGASVQCVVRLDGEIVGGATAVLDTIVPGGQVAWEAITFSDWLRGDSAECTGSVYD